jgi:hypothetical protein
MHVGYEGSRSVLADTDIEPASPQDDWSETKSYSPAQMNTTQQVYNFVNPPVIGDKTLVPLVLTDSRIGGPMTLTTDTAWCN